jgi:hypothetical protein
MWLISQDKQPVTTYNKGGKNIRLPEHAIHPLPGVTSVLPGLP